MKLIENVFISCFLVSFLAFLVSVSSNLKAEQTDRQEALQSVQTVQVVDRKLVMKGMGLTRMVTGDYYIGALYLDELTESILPEELIYLETNRSMVYRFVAERKISARGFSRKIAESIRINNDKKDITIEGKNVSQFLKLFKGSYKKGDELRFEYHMEMGTRIFLNDKLLGEFRRSRGLYTLLLNTWIGKRPPSANFKSGILGQNSNEYALELLEKFVFIN